MSPSQLQRKVLREGNKTDYPRQGDEVTIEYTGWLYDSSKSQNEYRGSQFDSSVGRGDFKTKIGVGRVIQGWDQAIPNMSLGEKAVLTIPGIWHMVTGKDLGPIFLVFEPHLLNDAMVTIEISKTSSSTQSPLWNEIPPNQGASIDGKSPILSVTVLFSILVMVLLKVLGPFTDVPVSK